MNRQRFDRQMSAEESLISRMERLYQDMSKGQKRLADYIIKHYDRAAYMTAAELGKEADVSESTAVRFAMLLGFSGFPEFHQSLQEVVRNRLNSVQRMESAMEHVREDRILDTVLNSDIDKIRITLEQIDRDSFRRAVDMILSAKTVYVVGIRSCAPLAAFLGFYLNQILEDVRIVNTNSASEIFEQMMRLSEEDVVIGISFPRYSKRTLKAMEFEENRKAGRIAITDSMHSPLTEHSDCCLIARSDMAAIVDSLVAPLSVINALIVNLAMRRKKEVMQTLNTMESIWQEYQVYESDEMEKISERGDSRETEEIPSGENHKKR